MRTRRVFGQTSSELMMVISVVCVAVTGASYAFVPRFQEGVQVLGANVQTMLSTGSFAGLGLSNVGTGDVARGDTGAAGGDGDTVPTPRPWGSGNPWFSGFGFGASFDFNAWLANYRTMLEQWRIQNQADGQPPPTGIRGLVCGEWGLSDIGTKLGIPDASLGMFMNAAKAFGFAAENDYRLTAREVAVLARLAGMSARLNHEQTFQKARDWMLRQMEDGRYPMILIRSPDGTPHWIEPTGVVRDEYGRITDYKYRDANSANEQSMSAAEFDVAWAAQGYEGVSLGRGSGVNLLAGFKPQ